MPAIDEIQRRLNELADTLDENGQVTLDAQAAANAWAETPYPMDLLGALNFKNGTTGLGLNEVCNQLMGEDLKLDAQEALNHVTAIDLDDLYGDFYTEHYGEEYEG